MTSIPAYSRRAGQRMCNGEANWDENKIAVTANKDRTVNCEAI